MSFILKLALSFTWFSFIIVWLDYHVGISDEFGHKFKHYYELVGGFCLLVSLILWILSILFLIWS